jgi:hypothetical protein
MVLGVAGALPGDAGRMWMPASYCLGPWAGMLLIPVIGHARGYPPYDHSCPPDRNGVSTAVRFYSCVNRRPSARSRSASWSLEPSSSS